LAREFRLFTGVDLVQPSEVERHVDAVMSMLFGRSLKKRKRRVPVLLPISPEPFVVPTDRDLRPSERRLFVRTHRTCVLGYGRLHDGPAMSVVYYVPTDEDQLLISTTAGRAKARAVLRNSKISLCVLDERWPFAYLQVYADAVIDRDRKLVVDVLMAVAGRMSGEAASDETRPFFESMAEEEGRVVVRCRPYETFAQPRPHKAGGESVAQGVSGAVPWDAPDPG
jgi:PPOX class probable F420-dependent enzyme